MKKFFLNIWLLFFAGAMISGNALSMTVFDPSNFVQNYMSAINAVKTEANTAESLRQQIQTSLDVGRSVQSLAGLSALTGAQEELRLYNQLRSVDDQLLSTINNGLRMFEDLRANWGASNLSWETFLKTRNENASARTEAMLKQYTTMNDEMSLVARRRQDIVTQLQGATGQTQALQAVGSAIDVLIGQQQQVISLMSSQGQAGLSKSVDAENSSRSAAGVNDAYQKKLRESSNKLGKL